MRADLDRFRKELGADCLDIVLLHCMMSAQWPEERLGAMDVLEEAREKGIIRARGVYCHTLEALQVLRSSPGFRSTRLASIPSRLTWTLIRRW
ncbi:MAG: hypothetical protein EXQ58_06090 [Acidobacteria bacterium]|nr:hypothetical protein [Acidobacteriota bacterium]